MYTECTDMYIINPAKYFVCLSRTLSSVDVVFCFTVTCLHCIINIALICVIIDSLLNEFHQNFFSYYFVKFVLHVDNSTFSH